MKCKQALDWAYPKRLDTFYKLAQIDIASATFFRSYREPLRHFNPFAELPLPVRQVED